MDLIEDKLNGNNPRNTMSTTALIAILVCSLIMTAIEHRNDHKCCKKEHVCGPESAEHTPAKGSNGPAEEKQP